MTPRSIKLAKFAVLWLGLALCGVAFWQTREVAADSLASTGAVTWAFAGLQMLLAWGLALASWRSYLRAYTGRVYSWRTVIRQTGYLLIGKYVPGGVIGFAARVYDEPDAQRKPLVWAGIAEQTVNAIMSLCVGAVLYIAAFKSNLVWLACLLFLPPLAVAGVRLLHLVSRRLPWLHKYAHHLEPDWRPVACAASLQMIQVMVWAMLLVTLAHHVYGLGNEAAIGVAGAFLIAVVAGMLVVVAPGGVGVREATLIGLSSPWLGVAHAVFLATLLRLLTILLDAFSGITAAAAGKG